MELEGKKVLKYKNEGREGEDKEERGEGRERDGGKEEWGQGEGQ